MESDDPLLLQPRIARRKSPRLNIIEDMALASVHQSETQEDPQSYRTAMQSAKAQLWQEAINKELKSISDTGTWQEIKVPEGASLVDSKWVFKTKLNERGEVIKYKARIVARGFTQEYGINYFDTYSPVARLTSLRVLLTIGQLRIWSFTKWMQILLSSMAHWRKISTWTSQMDISNRIRSQLDLSSSGHSMGSSNHLGYGGNSSAHT